MTNLWFLLCAFISALVFFITKLLRRPDRKNLPPGPKPWPIVGNILDLIGSVPHIHKSLHSLSQKHGELMLLKIGQMPVLVASSPDMAKLFLKTHDAVFASRPPLAAGKHLAYNFSDMACAPYGRHWRQARKIYMTELFTAKRLDSFEWIRVQERRRFLARLFSLSGQPVVLRDQLGRYTLSSICRMVMSHNYFDDSDIDRLDELKGMLDEWFLLNFVFNIGDWIKCLDFLDLQGYVKKM